MYSNLRFVISASLVGCAGLVSVLAFLPATFEERLLPSAQVAAAPAPPCSQPNWWHFDRNCLSRRGMPWVASVPASNATEVPSRAESATEQPLTEPQFSSASATEELPPQPNDVTASRQEPPTPSPVVEQAQVATQPSEAAPPQQEAAAQQQPSMQQQEVSAPQREASAPPVAAEPPLTKRRNIAPVRHAAPAAPPVAEKRRAAAPAAAERRVAKPAVETSPRASAAKKPAREDRGTKPTNEALNAVRKFQDNLRDIPVSSYAADGTPRTIVIRPTSIQDVYYYSAPAKSQ